LTRSSRCDKTEARQNSSQDGSLAIWPSLAGDSHALLRRCCGIADRACGLIVALVLLALRRDGSERWWMFSLDRLRRFMYRPDQY
jgi:hypothetical protein